MYPVDLSVGLVYSVHMSDPRERILDLACELYLKDGFDGFSMRKLAREVGVTAPALYRHFPSKEALLVEVVGEGYKILLQYLSKALRGETAEERFSLAGEAELDFSLAHPRYFRMFAGFTAVTEGGELPEELREMATSVHQFWMDRVREAMDAGILRRDDPERVGLTLWAHASGLLFLYLHDALDMDEETFREFFRSSFRNLFLGMGTSAFCERLASGDGACQVRVDD